MKLKWRRRRLPGKHRYTWLARVGRYSIELRPPYGEQTWNYEDQKPVFNIAIWDRTLENRPDTGAIICDRVEGFLEAEKQVVKLLKRRLRRELYSINSAIRELTKGE